MFLRSTPLGWRHLLREKNFSSGWRLRLFLATRDIAVTGRRYGPISERTVGSLSQRRGDMFRRFTDDHKLPFATAKTTLHTLPQPTAHDKNLTS
jgi:hypothetical protein